MKILLLADVECKALWDFYRKEELEGIDLILSSGDLNDEIGSGALCARKPRCKIQYTGTGRMHLCG